jgi:hypothetical protein
MVRIRAVKLRFRHVCNPAAASQWDAPSSTTQSYPEHPLYNAVEYTLQHAQANRDAGSPQ